MRDDAAAELGTRKEQDFATMIVENLAKAGVERTREDGQLTLRAARPDAGTWPYLAMDDGLLNKAGADNLLTILGKVDIEITTEGNFFRRRGF